MGVAGFGGRAPRREYGGRSEEQHRPFPEGTLEASEGSFRALLAKVSEMVTVSDRDGRIVYASPATKSVCGYTPEEFAAQHPFELVHPEDRPRCQEALKKLLGSPGLSLDLEYRIRHKDGTCRWVEGTFSSLLDDPEVRGLVATARDVTERKRRESNTAFLADLAKDFTRLRSPDEIMRAAGERMKRHFGVSRLTFAEVKEAADEVTVVYDNREQDLVRALGTQRLSDYVGGDYLREFKAGCPITVSDLKADPRTAARAEAYEAFRVRAQLIAPHVTDGGLDFVIAMQHPTPHDWRDDEIELVQELSSRVYLRLERAKAEEALRESEERYRTLFESIDEGFGIFEMLYDEKGRAVDYRILETNPAFGRMTGFADAVGKTSLELNPDAEPYWFETLGRVAETGEDTRFESYAEALDRWFEVYASRVGGEGSHRVVVVFNNTTERKRAEEALRASEERFRTLIENIRDYAIFMTDAHGFVTEWTKGAERVTGYAAEEMLGRHLSMFYTPEEAAAGDPERELAQATEEGRAEREAWRVRKDGERIFVNEIATAVRDDEGRLAGFTKISRDLTERRRAEEALRESEERYRLAADAAGLGRWEFIIETAELRGDATFNEHHGAPPGGKLGIEGHLEVMHPDDREAVRRRVASTLEERNGYEAEYRVLRPDGETRWILSRGRFVRGVGSTPDRLVGVTLDVTDSRELERERERARARELTARAEAAERERISRELHDRVAHSMGVAHQSLELHAALAGSAPSRAEEKLKLARETTRRALDQTRALSAELKRLQEEELGGGLSTALGALAKTSVPDGVEVDLTFSGDESAIPKPVGLQAYLAMREALRNAVKHSGCTRIGITLRARNGEVYGRVEDNGNGFDPEAVGKISPSWGVGLRSMRERTEMLGGSLRVDSRPGVGTSIELSVPLDGRR